MVSLPPMNPNSGSHVAPAATQTSTSNGPKGSDNERPEAVRYMLTCWVVMIVGELLHQILTVISTVLDPAALKESARAAAKARGEDLTDAMMSLGLIGSVVFMALLQLAVIALFAVALHALAKQRKWAPNARRLLQIFAIFFALRALTLFVTQPASSSIPVAFYAFDGIIQIMLAVAGVLGVFYASQKESVAYAQAAAPPEGRSHDRPGGANPPGGS